MKYKFLEKIVDLIDETIYRPSDYEIEIQEEEQMIKIKATNEDNEKKVVFTIDLRKENKWVGVNTLTLHKMVSRL